MNRRIFSVLMVLVLLLCACRAVETDRKTDAYCFFFPAAKVSASGGALCSTEQSASLFTSAPDALLQAYLQAAPPKDALPLLPEQWTLSSVQTDAATLSLTFTGSPADSLRQSLTCACLAKTLLQSDTLLRISFMLPGSSAPLILSESDVLLRDTAMLPQQEMLVLYLPDEMQRYLRQEVRTVEAMENTDKPRRIMELLLDGQSNSCIPAGTTLLNIGVENGICTVDLSSEFVQEMQPSFYTERMAIYSIVNSLTELPEITTVDFWVAGAPLDSLHFMKLSTGVLRDKQLIASPFDGGILNTTLYLTCADSGLLVGIPANLTRSEGLSEPELLFRALTQTEGLNGITSCIPHGTQLLSVRLEGGSCILDLNAEFLDGCSSADGERLAVRAVIATMCNLAEIRNVYILVEGLEPSYRDHSLQNLHQTQPDWFAS